MKFVAQDHMQSFDYDRTQPIKLTETHRDQRKDVSIRSVSYADLSGKPVKAYWVVPETQAPMPALLYVHPSPGNKDNFREEAITLAQHGAASLVIDAPWSQQPWDVPLAQPQGAYDAFVPVVKNLRRAIDVLAAQPNVDTSRLGYVGHSFGALFGGVLSGIEKRIKAFALLAAPSSFADVAVLNLPEIKGKPQEQEYKRVMQPIDPVGYVDKAAPAALLFQFGERDAFPRESMMTFAEVGSAPKKVIWYDADHYQVNEVGRNDRVKWLSEQLGL